VVNISGTKQNLPQPGPQQIACQQNGSSFKGIRDAAPCVDARFTLTKDQTIYWTYVISTS